MSGARSKTKAAWFMRSILRTVKLVIRLIFSHFKASSTVKVVMLVSLE